MGYGFAPEVSVETRLVKPIMAYLHKLWIRSSMYVERKMQGLVQRGGRDGYEAHVASFSAGRLEHLEGKKDRTG